MERVRNRIFLPEAVLKSIPSLISGDEYHKLTRSLRCRKGDFFSAICGDGFEYIIEITDINKYRALFTIIERLKTDTEPSLKISLYQSLLKSGGFSELIPQLVYLGVKRLIPVATVRSESRAKKFGEEKKERLARIVERASALCGRSILMETTDPLQFEEALADARQNYLNLIFWEEENPQPLKKALAQARFNKDMKIGIFTGPEGGFTAEEVRKAKKSKIIPASLGKRILDARTAPIAAISALLYESGDI